MRLMNATPRVSLALSALAALTLVLAACSRKPHPEEHAVSRSETSTSTRRTTVQTDATPRDTVLRDTTRILGTPGSPTGAESRGMPGEKPVPGTKK